MKPLFWVGSSKADLRTFPEEVRREMGYALFLAQSGGKHPDAKPLKGFGGAGVLEVVERFDGNAFRTIYTVRIANAVYVLHAFHMHSRRNRRERWRRQSRRSSSFEPDCDVPWSTTRSRTGRSEV